MQQFGERLRDLRKKNNMTTQQMADFVGVKRRAYVYYESGTREPNMEQLIKLADYFGVTLDYLVGRDT